MENQDYIEKIHRYLANVMEEPQRADFENEMKTNDHLRKAVGQEQQLLLGLRMAGDEDLRHTISLVHQNLENNGFFEEKGRIIPIYSTSKKLIMNRFIAIAAAAVILLCLAWWMFLRPDAPPGTDAAYAQYFKPETTQVQGIIAGFPSAFAGQMNAQDSLREALKLYQAGQYNDAAAALDSVLVRHPANDTAQFYLGMAHLNESRYARAIQVLLPITALSGSPFQLDAKWYLGLCYLKTDDGLPKAKEVFQELSDNASYKDQRSAQGLLRLIDK